MTVNNNESSDMSQYDSENVLSSYPDDIKKEMLRKSQEKARSRMDQDAKATQNAQAAQNVKSSDGPDNVKGVFEKPQSQPNVSVSGEPKKLDPKRGMGSAESLGASLIEGFKWILEIVRKILRLFFKSISDGTKDSLSGKEKGQAVLPRKGVRVEDLSTIPAALPAPELDNNKIKSNLLMLADDESIKKDAKMIIEENEGGGVPSERVAQVMAIVRDVAYDILKDSHGDLNLSTQNLVKGLSERQAIVTQKALEQFGEDAFDPDDFASVIVALPDMIVDDLFSGDAARELKAFLLSDDMAPFLAELGQRKEMIRIAQAQFQEGIVDADFKPAEDVDKEVDMLGARGNMPDIQRDDSLPQINRTARPRSA